MSLPNTAARDKNLASTKYLAIKAVGYSSAGKKALKH